MCRRHSFQRETMIRLLVTGACALFLVGCTGKTETPTPSGNTPAAPAVATDTKTVFDFGEEI
jgi:PBP1b-binding outer membrane lipoprotein LpoB